MTALGAVLGSAEWFPTRGWEIVALVVGVLAVASIAAELSGRRDARLRSRDRDTASDEDGHVAS